MPRLSRSSRLLRNAEAALISSIEIYSKPAFAYREETFAILALNAWELLLKSKLLQINKNRLDCLYVKFRKALAPGQQSKKLYVKRTRSGNKMTAGIDACRVSLEKAGFEVPAPVKKNLEALIEVRDNAVHFINASPQLSKQVLEIGTASLRNFIELGKQWLDLDLSSYNLYLMPIGFLPGGATATAITLSRQEQNIVNYLATMMKAGSSAEVQDYHLSLDVNISFKRTASDAADAIMVVNNPNDPKAVSVSMSEENIRKQYPWGYTELTEKLKKRYIDFKANNKYHELRKKLTANPQFMKTRYLDPARTSGTRKDFYNPNIVAEFDKSYTLKK